MPKTNKELQAIGKKVDPKQLTFVMEKVRNWVHFVGMDDAALAQVAGIILVAGQEYNNQQQSSNPTKATVISKKNSGKTEVKRINLFDPATYG